MKFSKHLDFWISFVNRNNSQYFYQILTIWYIIVRFQVFLSNTNNYMVTSNSISISYSGRSSRGVRTKMMDCGLDITFTFGLMPFGKVWTSYPFRYGSVCGLSSPVVGLHSVGRRTSGRFYRVCFGTGEFLRPQGAIPLAFSPFGGLGLLPGAWGAPKKGNADGAEGIFDLAGRVWASALRPDQA